MNLLIPFGVGIGLIIICGIASTPYNPFIRLVREKIVVEAPVEVKFTPQPVIEPFKHEKYPEIKNFLDTLPDCKWCIACGSYARYTRLEAEKQGINIGEITIVDTDRTRVKRLMMDGHRINYFYAEDGNRVYIDNMHNWRIILESNELKSHIKDKFGFDLNRIGFKDQKT